jgi:glycosyltransferase involved in cell wall biosynthesis
MSLVTVIIPLYRMANLLTEAIESVLVQTHRDFEIVAVDDESPDHSGEIAKSYSEVRYIWQTNQGVCAARNRGIRESKGEYLVFLDSDDRLLPHYLERNLQGFREQPDAAFVTGDYRWFGAEGTWHHHRCDPTPDHYATLLRFNFIGPPLPVMFRRDILERVGGFQVGRECAEDQDLFFRIARQYPIYCHHDVVAEYRRHSEQNSANYANMLRQAMRVLSAQWPYVKGNSVYEEAYREGKHFRQRLYGETLFRQMATAVRLGWIREAVRIGGVLLRYNPGAIKDGVQSTVRNAWMRPQAGP